MSLRRDVARVVRLKEFHCRVEQLLPPADRDYFFYALKEYNTYKSVAKLMLALNSCLDTPEKLDLLPSIRGLIPRHDRRKFDNLAPYNRMAHPPSPAFQPPPRGNSTPSSSSPEEGETGEGAGEGGEGGGRERRSPNGARVGSAKTVFLQREKGQSYGFSIRGGREHEIGIFVSHVDPFSLAERCGLAVGDRILSVNGFSFKSITHQSAVLILKSHDQLQVGVASVGVVPGQPRERKSLIWVDTSGNPVEEEETAELTTSMEEDQRGGDRLLESQDKHKVVLVVEEEQPLGFSLRGGREFSLGIFVSQVDAGSPAEQSGVKAGDQILAVNGHSFISILHQEAVAVLRAYTTLVLTLRSLGRLPQLVTEEREEVDGATPISPAQPPQPQPAAHKSGEGADHTHKEPVTIRADHTHRDIIRQQKRRSDWRKSVSRRSQSVREFFRPRSLYAPPPHHPPHSHSTHHQRLSQQDLLSPQSRLRTGSDGALAHHRKPRAVTHSPSAPRTISHQKTSSPSPLAISGTSPTSPYPPKTDQTNPQKQPTSQGGGGGRGEGGGEGGGEGAFFRYGVGTQLMLAAVSSSARALLEDSARRCLDEEEMEALSHRLREYERNGGVESFAEFLVSLLDTPTKMQLLSDIRSVLSPTDLVTFDGIVSLHEIAALQKRASLGNNRETTPTIHTVSTPSGGDQAKTAAAQQRREREGCGEGGPMVERGRERPTGGEVGREGAEPAVNTPERDQRIESSGDGGEREEEEEGEVGGVGDEGEKEGTPPVASEVEEEEEEGKGLEGIVEEEEGEGQREGMEDTHEVREREKEEEGEGEGELEPVTLQDNYNLVLYEIQTGHGGQGSLRRAEVSEGDMGTPQIGAFASDSASDLLTKASEEEPSMLGMQTRESFLEWNGDYNTDSLERRRHGDAPSKSPVIVEIVKSAPQLGLTITGGADTPSPGVIITDVKEGGAAGMDGFLQPGFEIVQVDGVRIRGLTHDTAARTLALAFRSERPTIELIVIPI